jgi:hypothetical protein
MPPAASPSARGAAEGPSDHLEGFLTRTSRIMMSFKIDIKLKEEFLLEPFVEAFTLLIFLPSQLLNFFLFSWTPAKLFIHGQPVVCGPNHTTPLV